MPKLDTPMHLLMHQHGKKIRALARSGRSAARIPLSDDDPYGLEWGDPETWPPLSYVRDHFLKPYVSPDATIMEIGPGGGRWTRYMLAARKIYAIDYHQELLDELKVHFDLENIDFIRNDGDNLPGVPNQSIDFIFSFGVFVHLEMDVIDRYLTNIKPILKPDSNVVLQYSDMTKPMARMNNAFSDNDPDKMRALVLSRGFRIYEEDTKTMWHSSLMRFGL